MEILRAFHSSQGAGIDRVQEKATAAVQAVRQEEAMEESSPNSRAHGGGGQQPFHRPPTTGGTRGDSRRHRGDGTGTGQYTPTAFTNAIGTRATRHTHPATSSGHYTQ